MENFDKMLDPLKDSTGELKANMHMLDEIVPVEEQVKYFQYSKYIQSDKEKKGLDRNYLIARLFTPNVNIEDKRYYLSVLAAIVDVAAYRAIETYHKSPLEPELGHWSALALAESKILLDTEFSGEKQFFVSTGLGGKNKKLRYFSVLATADRSIMSEFQRVVLQRELLFELERNDIEVEEFEFRDNYLRMSILCGLGHDAHDCIRNAIDEANLLGHYIDDRFLLTNVKQINNDEIRNLLEKKEETESNKPDFSNTD